MAESLPDVLRFKVGLRQENLGFGDALGDHVHDRGDALPKGQGIRDSAMSARKSGLVPSERGLEVPSLPGCISQGRTRGEALSNVVQCVQCCPMSRKRSRLT
jgi:hypothetical protein